VSSPCWALVAALVLLPALATAELHILSPRPREMFVRLPVPVLVHISGDMAEDTDIRVLLHVDGALVRAWRHSPPWRQPRGKSIVSLVNSHTSTTSKR